MKEKIRLAITAAAFMLSAVVHAQQLTLNDVIRIAQENSFDAQVAKLSFMSSYWTYRSFKADLKPSVNLSANLLGFDHSLVGVRNYETGQQAYVDENSMSNSVTLRSSLPPV
jgi:outer membrane protein TolC